MAAAPASGRLHLVMVRTEDRIRSSPGTWHLYFQLGETGFTGEGAGDGLPVSGGSCAPGPRAVCRPPPAPR